MSYQDPEQTFGKPRKTPGSLRIRASLSIDPEVKELALAYGGISEFFNDAAEYFLKKSVAARRKIKEGGYERD